MGLSPRQIGTGGAGEEDNAARQDSAVSAVGHDLLARSLSNHQQLKENEITEGNVALPSVISFSFVYSRSELRVPIPDPARSPEAAGDVILGRLLLGVGEDRLGVVKLNKVTGFASSFDVEEPGHL